MNAVMDVAQPPTAMAPAMPPRKRDTPKPPPRAEPARPAGRQVAIRLDDETLAHMAIVSQGLGLDNSSIIRLLLSEGLPGLVVRAREAIRKQQEAWGNPASAPEQS